MILRLKTTLVVSLENTVLTWTWEDCGQLRRDFFFPPQRKKEIEAKKKTGVSSPFNPRAFFPKMKNQLYSFCGCREAATNSDPHHTAVHNVVRLLEVSCALYSSCDEGMMRRWRGSTSFHPWGGQMSTFAMKGIFWDEFWRMNILKSCFCTWDMIPYQKEAWQGILEWWRTLEIATLGFNTTSVTY